MAVGIGVGRFVYTPILPPMMLALGLSKSIAGLIASANFAGYLTGALAASGTSPPGSLRLWLIGALLLSTVTTTAMALTDTVAGFMALRFIGGIASAFVLILSSVLVLDRLAERQRPRLAALHFSGVGIGIVASATLIAAQHQAGAGWGTMWVASGALSLVGALAVAVLVPAGSPSPMSAKGTVRRHHPGLRRMTIAYGLFGFGYVITATFLVAIVRATPVIRDLEPVIWTLVGLAAAPSVMVWTFIGQRIGIATAFSIAALTEAAGVLASVTIANAIGLCLAAVLVGGTFMGLTALGLLRGRMLAPDNPRPVMAAMTASFGVGQIAGPILAGVLSDALGGLTIPSFIAAAALVIAAWLAGR